MTLLCRDAVRKLQRALDRWILWLEKITIGNENVAVHKFVWGNSLRTTVSVGRAKM